MQKNTKKDKIHYPEIPVEDQNLPRISLILPYNLKMKKQPDLFHFVTAEADKIEKELLMKYDEEKVVPVIKKLRHLIQQMSCVPDGKTVCIFVSPFAEKVYFFTPSHLQFPILPGLDNPDRKL